MKKILLLLLLAASLHSSAQVTVTGMVANAGKKITLISQPKAPLLKGVSAFSPRPSFRIEGEKDINKLLQ